MEQVKDLMKQGQANRAVGSHDMNEHSSRSHSIITIVARGQNKIDNSVTFGTSLPLSYLLTLSMDQSKRFQLIVRQIASDRLGWLRARGEDRCDR